MVRHLRCAHHSIFFRPRRRAVSHAVRHAPSGAVMTCSMPQCRTACRSSCGRTRRALPDGCEGFFKDGKIVRQHDFSQRETGERTPFGLFVQLCSEESWCLCEAGIRRLVFLGSRCRPRSLSRMSWISGKQDVIALCSALRYGRVCTAPKSRSSSAASTRFLSSGIGRADIRAISYEGWLAVYAKTTDCGSRFSCRGLGTGDACRGVMSIDPSVFEPRFEGGDRVRSWRWHLRNDYASHLLYDRTAKEWRAVSACFSGGGRGPTGIAVSRLAHDPRRGSHVMPFMRLPGGATCAVKCEALAAVG